MLSGPLARDKGSVLATAAGVSAVSAENSSLFTIPRPGGLRTDAIAIWYAQNRTVIATGSVHGDQTILLKGFTNPEL